MKNKISKINKFEKTSLLKFEEFVNKNSNLLSRNSVLTFAQPVKEIDAISLLNAIHKKFNDSIYFSAPDDKYSFLAIDSLFNLPGETDHGWAKVFLQLGKIISINNLSSLKLSSLPIAVGGVKFDSKQNSDEWNDFRNYHFFIPKMILFTKNEKQYLIVNSICKSKFCKDELINEYSNSLSQFSELVSKSKTKLLNLKKIKEFNVKNGRKKWLASVESTKKLLNGDLKKIVIARRRQFKHSGSSVLQEKIRLLEKRFSDCFVFALSSKKSVFFGASPERFIKIKNSKIELDAMAGSAPKHSKTNNFKLKKDGKNLAEHNYVVDFIRNKLSPFTVKLNIEDKPGIKKLRNILHLHSKVSAKLKHDISPAVVIENIYPTPAVCGLPKEQALKEIRKIEEFDRGLYSGAVGWINLKLNCEFTVAIRSALLKDSILYAYSGAGIVKDSVPEAEFDETELKFNTILSLFNE